ncbi:hypothetical protein [Candidatus Poseidonia alphae]|uniref:hypothetical protein n=1 Tax=Candidatus Poseidonia alphae TaxID=1915863 RepID=UPI0030C6D9CA
MNEQKPRASLVVLGASFLFFPLVLCGIALVLYGHVTNGAFVRFGNSLLTSYTLASFVLLFSLFVYGDKRKRPVAPLLGMLGAALVGVMVSFMFLSQGDLLMEANGSIRAQVLSNIIRFSTTLIAVSISTLIVGGISFASLMNSPARQHIFREEE